MSGADKNRKNGLGSVQSACGDVLKMPGAMPGKRDITMADLCPFYVPFFRTGLKINVHGSEGHQDKQCTKSHILKLVLKKGS